MKRKVPNFFLTTKLLGSLAQNYFNLNGFGALTIPEVFNRSGTLSDEFMGRWRIFASGKRKLRVGNTSD